MTSIKNHENEKNLAGLAEILFRKSRDFFFRLSPDPKEASGSTTFSIRNDPNFVDDEDGWMREFLPKENEDDIDEIELEEIQDR